MTIQELVFKCKDVPSDVCGAECPYAKECKTFRNIIYATIIPSSLEPLLDHLDADFKARELNNVN